ncbi:PspC domain-containing protein [Sphingomonas rhizophila]|uniref:PspC domain-containing protein n=1 Tax=Sphingomonas rhizophila TaxID=2071607 RepID=A0A7G9SC09_9SPHN|nr:PspC domain-containing protein [Sphingomonas rhizophila]QNN65384.1 PspC domain-containing protein [Sphingomonas rhizophila]
MSRYSMNRRDKKLAGVASTLGEVFNIDPTFIRVGFAAIALLISWKLAIIAYVGAGLYLHFQKKGVINRFGERRRPPVLGGEYGDMNRRAPRASVHDLRTKLDENDRRMMAIDHHLHTQNDELAREIEALRGEK